MNKPSNTMHNENILRRLCNVHSSVVKIWRDTLLWFWNMNFLLGRKG
jgi:hypothetical protein